MTDSSINTAEPMIVVDHVDMIFNIANQQLNSLKEYLIALVRRQLFFREFKALEDINITINRGDVYGIVGTNGSGKSTLLKIIAGVLEPTHGKCSINGTIAPLIELGAGFDHELTAPLPPPRPISWLLTKPFRSATSVSRKSARLALMIWLKTTVLPCCLCPTISTRWNACARRPYGLKRAICEWMVQWKKSVRHIRPCNFCWKRGVPFGHDYILPYGDES